MNRRYTRKLASRLARTIVLALYLHGLRLNDKQGKFYISPDHWLKTEVIMSQAQTDTKIYYQSYP